MGSRNITLKVIGSYKLTRIIPCHKYKMRVFRVNPIMLVVALIALCSTTSTATSSSATIILDKNAVHQQEAFTSRILSTVAGSITDGGSTQNNIPATAAKLSGPAGITMDTFGDLYISNQGGHRIMKVTTSTGVISVVAGTGVAGYSGDGGKAVNAKVDSPEGIGIDKSGNIFFADPALHRIRKITVSTGIITTVAGNGDNFYDKDDVAATSTTLSSPRDLALDSDGNIYIADTLNNRIRKVTVSTGIITTVAGNGSSIQKGIEGSVTATAYSVYRPIATTVDKSGNFFIAMDSTSQIYKVTASTGLMTNVAGPYGSNDLVPIDPLDANIRPSSLALDNSGNIYMTTFGSILRWQLAANKVSILAGSGTYTGTGEGDGDKSTMAYLSSPRGVYPDSTGNFYFCDTGHNTVRKVTYADATHSSFTTQSPAAAPSSTTPGTPTSVITTSTSPPVTAYASYATEAPTQAPSKCSKHSSATSNVAASFHLTIFLLSSLLFMQLRRDA
jgi:sugar lactone lactonase YvrE